MAPWLVPALKAVLPHVGTIISAATPVFTRKRVEASNEQTRLLQQQIAELQTAASQNADHVKELAAQLEATVSALEDSAVAAEGRLRRVTWMAAGATATALLSLVLVITAT